MNIIFIGTSEFAVPSLEKLIKSSYQISAVITTPDKPQGRDQKLTPSLIKQKASAYNLKVLQPEKIEKYKANLSNLRPDLIIVIAYGQILPNSVLEIPKLGALNIHPSLLPKYRGASPIKTAILKGEKETGVTIIKMDEKMDHGPILSQIKTEIKDHQYYPEISKILAQKSSELLIETISSYIQGKITAKPQDDTKATYTQIFTRQDGKISWQKNAQGIERMVKALFPWPGTWTYFNNKRVKILKAKAVSKPQEGAVKTKNGYLLLEQVQPEGKQPMSGADFLRGIN